jgi:PAS domain S-box-containing protein
VTTSGSSGIGPGPLDESLRRLLAAFPGIVWVTDGELRTTAVFGGDLPRLGLAGGQMLGRPIVDFLEDRSETSPAVRAYRRALAGEGVTYRMTLGERVRQGQVEPLRDETGAVVGIVGMSFDATELAEADLALAELGLIVASSNDAIIGRTLDGTITSWNAGAERLYGYAAGEMIGRDHRVTIPPDGEDELGPVLERVAAGEPVDHFETVRLRKDGSRIEVSISISPIRNAAGEVVGSSAITHDIGERKRAEETRQQLAAIVDASEDAIVSRDPDGIVRSWNRGAERLLGYTAEEVIGRPLDLLSAPGASDELRGTRELLRRGERVKPFETVLRHADGSEITVSSASSAIFDSEGRVVGIAGIMRDISERIRAEQALRRSEESYRALFEGHPSPMWAYDPETLRFVAVNHAAIRTYGYTRDELLAMTIEEIRPEDDLPTLRTVLEVPVSERGPTVTRHRRKDGSVIDVRVLVSTIEFEGRPATLVLAQDITEQILVEEQLRQAQKAEAIGSLAAGIAHDFNNVLTLIRGATGVVLADLDDARARENLLRIDHAAEHATTLTRQLLAFSRQQVLQPEPTDLNAVVDATLDLVSRLIGEQIELDRALASGLPPILVDRGQLQQVIINLAVNARDAMPDGGLLSVRTAEAALDQAYAQEHLDVVPGRYVLLEITDSGTGMDAETAKRVFDPFFTTKAAGTGLGLATVQGIVKQSDGHIWLYSEPGLGTTFRIYLPPTDRPAEAPVEAPAAAAPSPEGDETILFVEDAELLRPLIAEVLESYGYTVLQAAHAAEALAFAESGGPIDLLLTDVVMPGMNGRELAETLLAGRPGLRVLFTSGYPADTVVRHGIAEARVAFIQKPFLADDLVAKIRAVLDAPA